MTGQPSTNPTSRLGAGDPALPSLPGRFLPSCLQKGDAGAFL